MVDATGTSKGQEPLSSNIQELVAQHIVRCRYDDLSPEVVRAAKAHLLDTLGVAVGGSGRPGCGIVAELVAEWGGSPDSTVLVYGSKVPVVSAALANGTMGHALDSDDNHDVIAYKASVATVPAALAVAQKVGGVSGKDFLTAYCVGSDLGCRMGLAIRPKPAHAMGRELGCFAAAAASAKLLKLDGEQTLYAVGLAHSEVSLSGMVTTSPALTKRLGIGLAARAGVFAALLAQKGYTSLRNVFQGTTGYYRIYHGQEGDMEELTADLGRRFEIARVAFKPFPSCRYTHGAVTGALAIAREHGIIARQIGDVVVQLCQRDAETVGGLGDSAQRAKAVRPQSPVDAQFSVPYTVATAFLRGAPRIRHFTAAGYGDEEVLALADRGRIVAVPALGQTARDVKPAIVTVKTLDGSTYEKRVDFPKGSPENPLTDDERLAKFWDCISHAAMPLYRDKVEEVVELVDSIEKLDDVSRIPQLLTA